MGWRRTKNKKRKSVGSPRHRWLPNPAATLKVARAILVVSLAGGAIGGSAYGLMQLDRSLRADLLARLDRAVPVYPDLPQGMAFLADADLDQAIQPVLDGDWTDAALCRRAAEAIAKVPWVRIVRSVRRFGDARLEIRCTYRLPAALVRCDAGYCLADQEGVRLPGRYAHDAGWPIIEGVAEPTPAPGSPWVGRDLRAGLTTLALLLRETFAHQVAGVSVENYEGRRNPSRAHIVLLTDRAGGRVAWGSEPGLEIEENTVGQKLAILRETFRKTGRVDAGFAVIDVTTFPDRFQVVVAEQTGL